MARYIDADELLERLESLGDDTLSSDNDEGIKIGISWATNEVKEMLYVQEEVVAVLPQDYHDRCMELEISRRFAAEENVSNYPHVLDAIHGELANAIGLVERMQKANDKSDE